MIQKLKGKFLLLTMSALLALLLLLLAGMNLINYRAVIADADEVLAILSQNRGVFPEFEGEPHRKERKGMSPETPYESRYFSVMLDEFHAIAQTDTRKIASIDHSGAISYAQAALASNKTQGFIKTFRFVLQPEGARTRIIFLDCSRSLDTARQFLLISLSIAAAGYVAAFFVVFILSGRILSPIAESYEKQKRFITDAGHELKTPLTIIQTNLDLLEMELGEEQECLSDLRQQSQRLRTITDELVLLARMEEGPSSVEKIDFPCSDIVLEAAQPFSSLSPQQNKSFVCTVQPQITLHGNARALERLVTLLLDNAFKYSPARGRIDLSLKTQGRNMLLTITNDTLQPLTQEQLSHVFDRFYRTDTSRSSDTSGHGIGLSVAKAIAAAHDGKIQAFSVEGGRFQILVTLPI